MTALDVWLHGRRVVDVHDQNGRLVLAWAEDLLERYAPRRARPLGPPRCTTPQDHPPPALVRSFLGGLLPEVSTSPRSRLARRAGTSSDDVPGLLAIVGGDVAGAAQFTAAGKRLSDGHHDVLADDAAVRRHLERAREEERLGDGDSSLPWVNPRPH